MKEKERRCSMGLSINWDALLAPIIIRIIEKLVDAFLKWLEEQSVEESAKLTEQLMGQIEVFTKADNKVCAAKDLFRWMNNIRNISV